VGAETLSPGFGAEDYESALIARILDGDEPAWETLVALHWKLVWKIGWMILRDVHAAEDVAQDTFVKVRERLPQFRGERPLRGWIQAISRNQARDELRRRRRRPREVSLDSLGLPATRQEDRWDERLDLERALAGLPCDERESLLLHRGGLTSEEIASHLGVAPTTIRSRIARARHRLAQGLKEYRERSG